MEAGPLLACGKPGHLRYSCVAKLAKDSPAPGRRDKSDTAVPQRTLKDDLLDEDPSEEDPSEEDPSEEDPSVADPFEENPPEDDLGDTGTLPSKF